MKENFYSVENRGNHEIMEFLTSKLYSELYNQITNIEYFNTNTIRHTIHAAIEDAISKYFIYGETEEGYNKLGLFENEMNSSDERLKRAINDESYHNEYFYKFNRERTYDPEEIAEIIDNELFFYLDLKPTKKSFKKKDELYAVDYVDVSLYKLLLNNPELIKTLDWRVFEMLLADILNTIGYEIELKTGTKDGGIDLIAIKKKSDFGQLRYLIQAKRWKNIVGVEPVRSLLFVHNNYRATKSCLATTSNFTSGAWSLANEYKYQIELKDFNGLRQWLEYAATIKLKTGILQ